MNVIKSEDQRVQRMMDNFVENYGEDVFREFIQALVNDESGGKWARRLGVSRERVRQWRAIFVQRIVYVSPAVVVQERLRRGV